MSRTDVLGYGDSHDANWSRSRDEHILADHVERQRGMHRIAEGVENGREIVRYPFRNREGVECREGQIFGE